MSWIRLGIHYNDLNIHCSVKATCSALSDCHNNIFMVLLESWSLAAFVKVRHSTILKVIRSTLINHF